MDLVNAQVVASYLKIKLDATLLNVKKDNTLHQLGLVSNVQITRDNKVLVSNVDPITANQEK